MHRKEKFMSSTKPVVVYGASGYTGRLVCEYLREFNVPFIAAGRDKARIQEALDLIPGINTVGRYARFRPLVVEAWIRGGSRYRDTPGEQDSLMVCAATSGRERLSRS